MTAVDTTTGELVPLPTSGPPARVSPELLAAQVAEVKELMRAVLVDGTDYGRIPGTPKPALFKSGAEMLLQWARLGHRLEQVEVEADEYGKHGVTYRCVVYSLADPTVVRATCDGYCGYDEPDRDAHTTRSGKSVPRSPWNTIIKMAQKRALVGATLQATATSGLFTQDVEDLPPHHAEEDWFVVNGWPGGDPDERAAHVALVETLKSAPPAVQQAFRQWRTDAGIDLAKRLTRSEFDACRRQYETLVGDQPASDEEVTPAEIVAEVTADTAGDGDAITEEICVFCHEVVDPFEEKVEGRGLVFTADGDAAHAKCRDEAADPF